MDYAFGADNLTADALVIATIKVMLSECPEIDTEYICYNASDTYIILMPKSQMNLISKTAFKIAYNKHDNIIIMQQFDTGTTIVQLLHDDLTIIRDAILEALHPHTTV